MSLHLSLDPGPTLHCTRASHWFHQGNCLTEFQRPQCSKGSAFPPLPSSSHGASASAPSSPPEAHSGPDGLLGKSRLRRNAAAQGGALRPRRGCGAFALQRRRGGRQGERRPGPQSGKQAPDIESRRLGAPQKTFPGLKFDKKCLHFSANVWTKL